MNKKYILLYEEKNKNTNRKRFKNSIVILFTLLLTAYLFYVLILRPVIGMADNGDFFRTINNSGMYYITQNYKDRHFGYFNRLYGIRKYTYDKYDIYISSVSLLVSVAKSIDTLVTKDNFFDLRFLGAIYSLLFIFAYYKTLRYLLKIFTSSGIFIAILAFIVFADIGYIAYFNSFYGEPAAYVFFILLIVSALEISFGEKITIWNLLFFSISAILFAASKQQHYLLGVIFALFAIRLAFLKKNTMWKAACFASAIAMLVVSLWMFSTVSDQIRHINQYFSITRGVILKSDNPQKDLKSLNMDAKFSMLMKKSYYDKYHIELPESELMKREFYPHISYINLLRFYIMHPLRLREKINLAVQNGYEIRPGMLGNYEKREGMKYGEKYNFFGFWSNFKSSAIPKNLNLIVLFYVLYFLAIVHLYFKNIKLKRKHKNFIFEIMAAIGFIGIVQIVISFIGAGDNDLQKHLFLYNICFDIMFFWLVIMFVNYYIMILGFKRRNK